MSDSRPVINIHDRIYRWVINVLKFLEKVPRTITTTSIIGQLSRSITSVGANDREANSSSTVKEFCYKLGLAKKEADESIYWITMIGDLFHQLKQQSQELVDEGREVISIVSTIIRNSKKTSRERKVDKHKSTD